MHSAKEANLFVREDANSVAVKFKKWDVLLALEGSIFDCIMSKISITHDDLREVGLFGFYRFVGIGGESPLF